MHLIKRLLAKYTAFIWAILRPLGSWGVFGVAFLDSAAYGIPLDPVVASYIYVRPAGIWLFAFMAAAGSAVGSLVPYGIGRAGGELLLLKRIDRHKLERMRDRFESQEFWAMAIPSMLPPPTPFKLFVLCAGVFEMRVALFLIAIFLGRFARFLLLGFLTIRYGPQIVGLAMRILREHMILLLIALGALALIIWLTIRSRKLVTETPDETEDESVA
ncbi:MAG TPA: VTT domain-containing protein [Terriglobales bacterium]